jgi:hypothetical protein
MSDKDLVEWSFPELRKHCLTQLVDGLILGGFKGMDAALWEVLTTTMSWRDLQVARIKEEAQMNAVNIEKIKQARKLLGEVKSSLKLIETTCAECQSILRTHDSDAEWEVFNGICQASDILYRLTLMAEGD